MAEWQNHLHIKTEWQQAKRGELTLQELAASIGKKLIAMWKTQQDDDELLDLSFSFEGMGETPGLSIVEFDEEMERLYDWGDTLLDNRWNGKKKCWIETF